jgi:hypothetical protein
MSEQSSSIACEICGGWHPTEAHAQYEKEAREKRMEEIKARPDSAYRFDALGFTPEKKGDIEPWMHEVIEKAKDLGDDLQDSGFFHHTWGGRGSRQNIDEAIGFITQESFQATPEKILNTGGGVLLTGEGGAVWFEEHNAGTPLSFEYQHQISREVLESQEQWIKSRKQEDLKKYKDELERWLNYQMVADQQGQEIGIQPVYDKKVFLDLLENLDSVEARRQVALMMMRGRAFRGPSIGIIFQESPKLLNEFIVSKGFKSASTTTFHQTTYSNQAGEEVAVILQDKRKHADYVVNEGLVYPNMKIKDIGSAQKLYQDFLHGLFVTYGSIEAQREVLELMLKATQDHKERRLPIYNFYGKLVWPRPEQKNESKV